MWIFTVARHVAISALRRRKLEERPLPPKFVEGWTDALLSMPDAILDQQENDAELERKIAKLDDTEETIVRLSFWSDLSLREIAPIVGKSFAQVGRDLRGALRKLGNDMGEGS